MVGTWRSQSWTPVGLSRLVVELAEEPRCPAAIEGHALPSFGGVGGDPGSSVSPPALAASWGRPM